MHVHLSGPTQIKKRGREAGDPANLMSIQPLRFDVVELSDSYSNRSYLKMPDKKINYNAIGQSIDTTWGRSSTPLTASRSVKMRLIGANMLEISFKEIINFVAEKEMIVMRRNCEEASLKIIDAHLKDMKKNYKDLTGDSLSASEVSTSDTLEIIGFNVHNPKRTAYYRRKMIVELS